MKLLSHVRLSATPWTVAYQASPSMGFCRQEYWSGLPFPSPGDLPDPGIKPAFPCLLHRRWIFLLLSHLGRPLGALETLLLLLLLSRFSRVRLCATLMDCSLPGFSVHGILQARTLGWVAISFSKGSSRPRDRTWVSLIGGRHFNL